MTIQLRGDTAANWTSANPVLAARQVGLETDTQKFKVGDGSTAWSSLSYWGGSGTGTVTSVALSGGSTGLSVSGSPITTSGTITLGGTLVVANGGTGAATLTGYVKGAGTSALTASATIPTTDLSGTLQAAQFPALTGDVTTAGGALATTIAAGAVSLAKMANLAANSIIGNNTGSPATPIALTAAQVRTLINVADGATANAGTVTSVSGAGTVSGLTLTGTVTGSGSLTLGGTLSVAASDFASQTANRVLAAPDGSAGVPSFRALVAADIPTLNQNTTGSAATLTTSRNFSISGGGITAATVGFNGSAAVVLNASVDAGHITLARMADVATATVFYRKTAGTGAPEVQTLATLKTDLGLTGTNSGDQTSIVGITGSLAEFNTALTGADFATGGGTATGTNTGDQTITLTGDVTGSGTGSFAATIAADSVSNTKLANMATATFKGRVTAGTGDPEDLTGTQATTLLDVFTTSLKGLAPASGGGTTNFLRADGTWTAPGGGGGSGDVVGPASATDNAVARYDTTTGKLLQDSRMLVDDDGRATTWINSNALEGVVRSEYWIRQDSDYTLTSSTAEQKLFNESANGRLTLPVGTYFFDALLYLTTMSATSGNMAFDPIGGGTAVGAEFLYHTVGIDNTTPTNAGTQTGSGTATQQTVASMVTAGTGTGMIARITGTFVITTAGTIIPSGTLVTANAAVVKVGSYFRTWRAADQNTNFVGAWD